MNTTNEISQTKTPPGRKPKEVWNYFQGVGEKKEGHQGCRCNYCAWSQTRGEPNIMEAHLALSCHKVPCEIKEKFLNVVKIRGENQTYHNKTAKRKRNGQSQITNFYESDEIDSAKQNNCNNTVAKFFICCGVSFNLVEHPFFIDMVKSLCPGYDPPCANTLSNNFLYTKLAEVVVDQQLMLKNETNLTLGEYIFSVF